MKRAIALLAMIPGLLVAREIKTLQQHNAVFSLLSNHATLTAEAKSNAEKAKSLQPPGAVSVPPKTEFETTAMYNSRLSAARTKAESEYRASVAEVQRNGVELDARLRLAAGALLKTLNDLDTLDKLDTCLKVTMETYDADTQTVSAMTPELYLFGCDDDKKLAAVYAKKTLPSFKCSIDKARRLRGCSDKGGLFCTIRFVSPKIKLSQEVMTVPRTAGEQLAEAAGKGAIAGIMAAIDPNLIQGRDFSTSDVKDSDANIIWIEEWTSSSYLAFYDKKGNPIE